MSPPNPSSSTRLKALLGEVHQLACEYYRLTGKPLGVTGEIAEYVAAELLGLELAPARTPGYDATRVANGRTERLQIKGRTFRKNAKPGQRLGAIKRNGGCDYVLLVLLDVETLNAREIWQAAYASVEECLARPGSKARERGALRVSEFKRIAQRIWPLDE